MNDKITKVCEFNHSMEKVWTAITTGELISKWFLKTNFKAEQGFAYSFKHEEGDECTTINGTVLEVTPITKLVYTWIVAGTEVITTVSWNLSETSKGTQLILTHSGIGGYPQDQIPVMFESFSGGWDNCTNSLTQFLED